MPVPLRNLGPECRLSKVRVNGSANIGFGSVAEVGPQGREIRFFKRFEHTPLLRSCA